MVTVQPFVYQAAPSRVIFGPGTIKQLGAELERQDVKLPLLLSTPQQVEQVHAIATQLDGKIAGIFSEATMHTPTDVTDKALRFIKEKAADSIVSLGGGSTIGLGKALGIRTDLPHFCIPTTYAGSEMTPILGETEDGVKKTRTDSKILPHVVIYDVDLTLSLPARMSASSGVNAIAHAVEALYSPSANPIINLLAIESISSFVSSLPIIMANPDDMDARSVTQYAAWLAGVCLGSVGMGLHHKLCHTLGGSFGLPHAETHTIVLPHALAYNAPRIPEVMAKLATAFPESNGDPIAGLNALCDRLGVERSLKAFGFREKDIEVAADIACKNEYPNPRPIEKAPISELIRRAWAGENARADL